MIRQSPYRLVFRPRPQTYHGPGGFELVQGQSYARWVVNDHCHVRDAEGNWHIFGITHPQTSCNHTHEGEVQLFHARGGQSPLEMYEDLGTILPPSQRPMERKEIHSPSIIRKDGAYYMMYGPHQMRMAVSTDLCHWELLGTLFEGGNPSARDPQLLKTDDGYLVCYCESQEIYFRTSQDLLHWGPPRLLQQFPHWICPESPFLFRHGKRWYLFVCLFDGVNDLHTLPGSYQMITQVYSATDLRTFTEKDFCCTLRAHAPEILEYQGAIYLSSAFYPENGIQIAELEMEELTP